MKRNRNVVLLGIGAFLGCSIALHLLRPLFIETFGISISVFTSIIGLILCLISYLYYIDERKKEFGFFYGRIKEHNKNSNTFFILSVAVQFFQVNNLEFTAIILGISALLLATGLYLDKSISHVGNIKV